MGSRGGIMIVTKQWFVIHNDGQIYMMGDSTGQHVESIYDITEFDTEQELLEYIAEHGLVYPEEME
jgi:hypothetical protein